jgi:hypothetical protein
MWEAGEVTRAVVKSRTQGRGQDSHLPAGLQEGGAQGVSRTSLPPLPNPAPRVLTVLQYFLRVLSYLLKTFFPP